MQAEKVKLSELISASDCIEAISAIESDRRNYLGSLGDWLSGKETELKAAAKKKIDSINRKLFQFPDEC